MNGEPAIQAHRHDTLRDHRDRIDRVRRHIEAHLDETLRLDTLARVAAFSPCHFHRIFRAHAGETVHGFVHRLRLERAAQHLLQTRRSVTEIGGAAGYDTPAAFTRAFGAWFGVPPSRFRRDGGAGSAPHPPPAPPTRPNEGGTMMTPEMRDEPELRTLGVRRTGSYHTAAAEAWQALMTYAGPRGLLGPRSRCLAISHDDPAITPGEKLRYDACIVVGPDVEAEGDDVTVITIPAGRFAVFLHEGSYAGLAATYGRIYGEWLPTSGCELRDHPPLEAYLNTPQDTPEDELRTEILVPIR